jgi:hypothetical protein
VEIAEPKAMGRSVSNGFVEQQVSVDGALGLRFAWSEQKMETVCGSHGPIRENAVLI